MSFSLKSLFWLLSFVSVNVAWVCYGPTKDLAVFLAFSLGFAFTLPTKPNDSFWGLLGRAVTGAIVGSGVGWFAHSQVNPIFYSPLGWATLPLVAITFGPPIGIFIATSKLLFIGLSRKFPNDRVLSHGGSIYNWLFVFISLMVLLAIPKRIPVVFRTTSYSLQNHTVDSIRRMDSSRVLVFTSKAGVLWAPVADLRDIRPVDPSSSKHGVIATSS